MSDSTKQTVSVVNSFLLFATLGMLGFIGHVSWQNSIRLESLMAGQVTRAEFNRTVEGLREEQQKLNTKITEFTIELVKLRNVPR